MQKLIFLVILSFTSTTFLSAQNNDKKIHSISFKVDDVEVTKFDIAETTYKRAIEMRIDKKIEGYPTFSKDKKLIPTKFNAFIASVHFAYAEHRPLILSPDIIWLTICQGLSIHVNKNHKKYKDKIVNNSTKKEIIFRNDMFRKGLNNNWETSFQIFADSINQYLKKDYYDFFVPDYSTTTKLEKAAYQITLMESVQKYFSYTAWTGCGIPEIILEGTPDDWKTIKSKIDMLRKFELNIWADNLEQIIDEFIKASEGKPDTEFWKSIYKTSKHYEAVFPSGWIIKFFPYYLQSSFKIPHKDGYLQAELITNPYIDGENYRLSRLMTRDFPSGISKVPFKWKYKEYTNQELKIFDMEAYSGFIGISQNKKTKSLKAEISWAIRDKNAPWLGADNFPYPNTRKPIEFWLNKTIKNPDSWPIFMPDNYKTYKQSLEFLKKHIYQEVAKQNTKDLNGKVKLKFTITWAGTVANIKILEKGNKKENELATKIIKELPAWKPAQKIMNGDYPNQLYSINFEQIVYVDFNQKK